MSVAQPPAETMVRMGALVNETSWMVSPKVVEPLLHDLNNLKQHADEAMEYAKFCVLKVRAAVNCLQRKLPHASIPKYVTDKSEKNTWISRDLHRRRIASIPTVEEQLEYLMSQPVMQHENGGLGIDLRNALSEWQSRLSTVLKLATNDHLVGATDFSEQSEAAIIQERYSEPLLKIAKAQLLVHEAITTIKCFRSAMDIDSHVYPQSNILTEYANNDDRLLCPYASEHEHSTL